MIPGLDSATPPTAAQVAAARATGVRLWSGYLATAGQGGSAFGLLRVWTEAEFQVAAGAGSPPIAFCSGWDDPAGCAQLAAAWGVRLCLDVESGIRGDGPWVQPWLDASGAGLYGIESVHSGRSAAFHIAAWYPGLDFGSTWPGIWARPPGPAGWQWQGDHSEFGAEVDRGWYDDWFGGETVDPRVIVYLAYLAFGAVPSPADLDFWVGHVPPQGSMTLFDVVAAIAAAQGPTTWRSELAQLRTDLEAGSFPGPAVALQPHTHPLTGSSGPAQAS